jgi:hypothetical protein
MRTGTVKFFNEKVTDSLDEETGKTFCSRFRNQRGRITRGDRVSAMKKKKEKERKVAAKVAVIT